MASVKEEVLLKGSFQENRQSESGETISKRK